MTSDDIESLIRSSIEPTEPQDSILSVLCEHEGKQVNKRLIALLNEKVPGQDIRLRHSVTTSLTWGSRMDSNEYRRSISLSYNSKNLRVDLSFIEEHNESIFSALKERNAARLASLEKKDEMGRLAAAVHQLIQAQRTIDSLIKNGGPFETNRYAIGDMIEEALEKSYKKGR